jgi:hypothetical protein
MHSRVEPRPSPLFSDQLPSEPGKPGKAFAIATLLCFGNKISKNSLVVGIVRCMYNAINPGIRVTTLRF